jgi:RHS repeat-associated protein
VAYGRLDSATNTLPTDHRFTGQKEDATGLYYYNARYYDPTLGTFISPDSLIPDPDNFWDYNRYMYVRGNPLRWVDPTGHCAGDPNDPNNPDAECWGMIDQIQSTYTNIFIQNQDLWILVTIQAVAEWKGGKAVRQWRDGWRK